MWAPKTLNPVEVQTGLLWTKRLKSLQNNDHKINMKELLEIADTLKISTGNIWLIVYECSGMKI